MTQPVVPSRISGPVVSTSATGRQLAMGPPGPPGPGGPPGPPGPSGGTAGIQIELNGGAAFPSEPILNLLPTWAATASATDNPGLRRTDLQLGGTIVNSVVQGFTTWNPTTLAPATAGVVYSAIFTGQTTSASHTAVQIGPNVPLPGQAAATIDGVTFTPPTNGTLRIDYELDIASTTLTSPAGAITKGTWAWAVKGATVTSLGAGPIQSLAIGTNSGSLPSGWAVTLQVASGQAQLVVTTDSSDTYTCKAVIQFGYTL